MRALVLALLAALSPATSCNPSSGPPPVQSAPPVQDPSGCDGACAGAQGACKQHSPKPVDYCLARCRAAAGVMKGPSVSCIAVEFTCDEYCPQP